MTGFRSTSRAHHTPPAQVVAKETARLAEELLSDILLSRSRRRMLETQIDSKIRSTWRLISAEIINDAEAVHEAAEVVRIDGQFQNDLARLRRTALIHHWLLTLLGSLLWVSGMLGFLHFFKPGEVEAAFKASALPPEPVISAILVGFTVGLLSARKGWFFGGVSVTVGLVLTMLMYEGAFYGSVAYLFIFLPLVVSAGAFGGYLADVLRDQEAYSERD